MRFLCVFLSLLLSCCCQQLFGQHKLASDSAIDSLLQGKIPGLNVTHSPAYQRRFSKEELFEKMLSDSKVVINFDSSFYIVDSFSLNNYTPNPSIVNSPLAISRTFSKYTDTNYIIGFFAADLGVMCAYYDKPPFFIKDSASADWKLGGKYNTIKILMYWNNNLIQKNGSISYLSNYQLEKLNTTTMDGAGIIYDLDMVTPYKNQYYQCKVLAIQNNSCIIRLYYFYNRVSNKKIKKFILSQLGMVKFK